MNKFITPIFCALVANFLLILTIFFVPFINKLFRGSIIFLLPFAFFFLLGLALTIFTLKTKVAKKLKILLLLTGISSSGVFVSIILHNFIYGLFIFLFGQDIWNRIGIGDEPVFFLIAVVFCPLGLLFGIIGSIVLFIKNKNNK